MIPRKKIRLGDLLVQEGTITEAQLKEALSSQRETGRKLGQALVDLKMVREEHLLDLLSKQLSIPFVDLRFYKFQPELVRKLPETYARRFRAIVLSAEKDGTLLVGFSDPTDIFATDELSNILKVPVKQAVIRDSDLLRAIDMLYRRTDEIAGLAQELQDEIEDTQVDLEQMLQGRDVEDAPVVRLLQTIFEDAVIAKASDIHVEPDENVLRIRQRVDGVLHEQEMPGRRIAPAVVSRLKLMAGLNISEKRLPQDGRFNVRVKDKRIDVRISTMPVQYGESVVMRLLDQTGGILNLEQVGMPPAMLARFRSLISRPHGIVLVTGPTGSGKTTTLYGALSELNDPGKKIITVEDPVEYRLPRISQVQVNERIGLSFARVLRTALRQDPDIVLVGEMRDQETVEIGLRAAMTGHFVLSTLHTNDAISTATRLLDMGAQGFLLGGALQAILAQRLVRRICDNCSEDDPLEPGQMAWVRGMFGRERASQWKYKRGRGCPYCSNSGYRGRVGVYELLEINTPLADALRQGDNALFTRTARTMKGYRTLAQSGMVLVLQGVTTVEEIVRIAGAVEEVQEPLAPKEEAAASEPERKAP